MFDNRLRPLIDPWLDRAGTAMAQRGIAADHVTWAGFALGMAAAAFIAGSMYWTGLLLIVLSRLCDGLDGAVARANAKTDLGGYLDIVLDFAFYGAIPFAFVIADPAANAVAGAGLIAAFYINGSSFLAYAMFAEKRGITETDRGMKSLLYTAGLAEASETIAVFVLFCLFPGSFAIIAVAFALITLVTATSRIALACRNFR